MQDVIPLIAESIPPFIGKDASSNGQHASFAFIPERLQHHQNLLCAIPTGVTTHQRRQCWARITGNPLIAIVLADSPKSIRNVSIRQIYKCPN